MVHSEFLTDLLCIEEAAEAALNEMRLTDELQSPCATHLRKMLDKAKHIE